MDKYNLVWPEGFEDYEWELESKGWFNDVKVVIADKVLKPTFYDPIRLSQDVEAEISSSLVFVVSDLIVVDKVCKKSIEQAIKYLAENGQLTK